MAPLQRHPSCDQSLKVAPTPAHIVPHGLLTEAVQAWIIVSVASRPVL